VASPGPGLGSSRGRVKRSKCQIREILFEKPKNGSKQAPGTFLGPLKKYLNKNLERKYIQHSINPAETSILFILKKKEIFVYI
jgi:hypothetical protein